MIDYIYLGPTPAKEPCVQTTDPDYGVKARAECNRYIALLKRVYAAAHDGRECPAIIRIKTESHDFGCYYEVVASYDWNDREACEAAYWLDANAPESWPEQYLCDEGQPAGGWQTVKAAFHGASDRCQ